MNDQSLSERGEQRRAQILQLAHGAARRRRARRFAIGSVYGLAVAGVGAMILVRMQATSSTEQFARPAMARTSPVAPSQPSNAIVYIQTDPTITDRLTLPPVTPRWTSIGDQELLNELAAAGQPAGIVCMNGKTTLLPR